MAHQLKMEMKFGPFRGSYLPVLMEAVRRTTGPVLELGCGIYSTNPLHWACFVSKRKLVTYENWHHYFHFLRAYETDFHEVHCISDYSKIDISGPWSVAFVDHEPQQHGGKTRRWQEVKRLTHAEYVVVHDSERQVDKKYGYSKVAHLFKYRFDFKDTWPETTVFSNTHDLTNFLGQDA